MTDTEPELGDEEPAAKIARERDFRCGEPLSDNQQAIAVICAGEVQGGCALRNVRLWKRDTIHGCDVRKGATVEVTRFSGSTAFATASFRAKLLIDGCNLTGPVNWSNATFDDGVHIHWPDTDLALRAAGRAALLTRHPIR